MKKILSGILAASLVLSFAAVGTMAANNHKGNIDFYGYVLNADDENIYAASAGDAQVETSMGNVTAPKRIDPKSEIRVQIVDDDGATSETTSGPTSYALQDEDFFKMSIDKDKNAKLISSIVLDDDKRLDTGDVATSPTPKRGPVIKFTLADYTGTTEIQTSGTVTFKAKKNDNDSKIPTNTDYGTFSKDDEYTFKYSFWINNAEAGNDANPDGGDRVYMNPEKNETNTLVWGDDIAALNFESDDAATKFYSRLETSVDRALYAEYGDPVDAELWFFDFVGNPSVPSTSRATLTLGVPWDDTKDYVPNPDNIYLYQKNADGTLTDVTAKFTTFSEDGEDIAGWSIKTRTLGTYVMSDTELDIETYNEEETGSSTAPTTSSTPSTSGGKDIPQTGSSDMVNVAVVAAVVSLAAAGAVAFRKAK